MVTSLWERTDRAHPKSLIAEFLGTFLFMFLGGAVSANASMGNTYGGAIARAIGNGAAYAVCVYCTAKISGGHLNPAVSTGFLACNLPNFKRGSYFGYVFAQLLGAAFACVLLFLAMPADAMVNHHGYGSFATLGVLSKRHPMTVFFGEMICTFALVFTVFGVVHSYNFGSTGPLAIGMAVSASTFAIGPYSGCSINPARTLAPMLVFGYGEFSWVYMLQLIGIMLGGFFAGKIYQKFFLPSD